jgi:hypothetical protein
MVQQNAQSFFAQTEQALGTSQPQFVKDDCGHDNLLAFSCKRRGFRPSCGARRMSQSAAHLVDHVIPRVPVRQ